MLYLPEMTVFYHNWFFFFIYYFSQIKAHCKKIQTEKTIDQTKDIHMTPLMAEQNVLLWSADIH